jgi:hypothetical protein
MTIRYFKTLACCAALSALAWLPGSLAAQDFGYIPTEPEYALTSAQDATQEAPAVDDMPAPEMSAPADSGVSYSMKDGCCDSCCGWHTVFGVEAVYLNPDVNSRPLLFDDGGDIFVGSDIVDLDFTGSPRIWLGAENCCGHGFRVRYWDFDSCNNASEVLFFDDPTDTYYKKDWDLIDLPVIINARADLDVYAVDLEYTHRFCCHCGEGLFFIGARHGALEYSESLEVVSVPQDVVGVLASERRFDGTGVTLGLEGTRGLPNHCDWSIVWGARGSVLYGNDKGLVASVVTEDVATGVQLAIFEDNTEMYVLEAQAGVQWARRIECMCVNAFARVVFEYQNWQAEEDVAIIEEQFVNGPAALVTSRSLDVDFYGVAASAGFTW